jgi:DNA-binding transcriptional ArsR family regulator
MKLSSIAIRATYATGSLDPAGPGPGATVPCTRPVNGVTASANMSKATTPQRQSRMMKALSHPLRHRILEELNEDASSPSDLAVKLNEPLGNVSYHVKALAKLDAIELVGTKPVRGAVEHFYRATMRPFFEDEQWSDLPISIRNNLLDTTVQKAWENLVEAANEGGFDDPDTHVSWTALDLDEKGYEEMTSLLAETLDKALKIHAKSSGRLGEGADAEETERTELTIFHYHRPKKEDSQTP